MPASEAERRFEGLVGEGMFWFRFWSRRICQVVDACSLDALVLWVGSYRGFLVAAASISWELAPKLFVFGFSRQLWLELDLRGRPLSRFSCTTSRPSYFENVGEGTEGKLGVIGVERMVLPLLVPG